LKNEKKPGRRKSLVPLVRKGKQGVLTHGREEKRETVFAGNNWAAGEESSTPTANGGEKRKSNPDAPVREERGSNPSKG